MGISEGDTAADRGEPSVCVREQKWDVHVLKCVYCDQEHHTFIFKGIVYQKNEKIFIYSPKPV